MRSAPTLQMGKGTDFSSQRQWQTLGPSRQVINWGCFPRPPLCQQTQGRGKGRNSEVLLHIATWDGLAPPPASPPSAGCWVLGLERAEES